MKHVKIPLRRNVNLGMGTRVLTVGEKVLIYCDRNNEYLGMAQILECNKGTIFVQVKDDPDGRQRSNFFLGGLPQVFNCTNKSEQTEFVARKLGYDEKEDRNYIRLFEWFERHCDISEPTDFWIYRWRWIKMVDENMPKPKIPQQQFGLMRCDCGHFHEKDVDEIYIWKLKHGLRWNIEVKREGGVSYAEIQKVLGDVSNAFRMQYEAESKILDAIGADKNRLYDKKQQPLQQAPVNTPAQPQPQPQQAQVLPQAPVTPAPAPTPTQPLPKTELA